jgi:TonB family protein
MISNDPTPDEVEFASAPTEEIPAVVEEPVVEAPVVAATQPTKARHESPAYMTAPGILFESEPIYADEVRHTLPPPILSRDGQGYAITVIEEKGGQRNGLLLAATAFAVVVALGSWAVSLFNKSLDIGAIGDDRSIAMLLDDVPMPTEEEPEKPKNEKDAGGGGGGGKEEKDPPSLGDMANQTKNPVRPPDANTYRSDNFELKVPVPSTEGNKTFEQKYDKYGDPNSKFTGISNGPGRGGGLGTGDGTGQGSGNGTGAGSGSGSGYGGGSGSGNGDGTGAGDGRGAPPPVAARVTQPLRITFKQKAQYTDAARTNGVQGTVTLRVTFLASGGIGSITTVKGLPHGLTEQAIAAARNMKFEPEMAGGVPRTTTRPVSFTFNIY